MADDDERPRKKGGKLKALLILFLLLLVLGGGVGAWYYFFSDLPGSRSANAGAAGGAVTTQVVTPPPTENLTTMTMPTFLLNLADPLGRRYIKLTMDVEVASPGVVQEIEQQMPRIRDSVIMLLSSKSYADLMPTESKILLKDEIVDRINQVLQGPKVTRVFFTDLVIQ